MICPRCGTQNEADAQFCSECGGSFQAGCRNCGATNKPGAKFCNRCGTALAGPGTDEGRAAWPQATAAPAAVAERRLVTVLFADLVGFTPFAEERDAEEVRDTLSRYFDLCSEIALRYGGTVEKFIGDAVMAMWGAPTAHEDDAERAVRAALEIVDAVNALGPGIQARAGLLTGEAAVTLGATNQGMVAGDLVNTAARLQSVAPAGAVLVGEATYRASSGAVVFEEVGDQVLKGKQSPVPAWRAVRIVAERGGRNRAEGLETPFVGRADELRLLKDLFHATGREKRARLVSVMGPAGIGKSRLAWEFLKYVDGLVDDTYWHSGRSPAYGEGITFWALGEMIRGRCALLESDDEATTRQKVADSVAQWVPVDEERKWVERALLTLLGFESGMGPEQLFGAWRTFFERIAAAGTVALVFEDLHHADSGTLDFIDHLLEWSRGFPLFIVTLARPELLDRRPNWGAGKRNFTSTLLEPLPEPQMRELLAGLVPGLPEPAVASIVQRADGIPLYAVETVRMLLAEGRIRLEVGTYVPVGDLTQLAVPETLTALISSRLDSLDSPDRALVHDAAVVGLSFTVAALSAVAGVAEDELHERLIGLVRRELLTREVDPRSPELGQFVFVQALIREVAYNTLSRKDRKTRHLAAARYFEQLGLDELASALAGHYLAAHANAGQGAEADALAAQARIALKAAAVRAAALGAHDQAVTFLEQALTVTGDVAEQAELLEMAGHSATVAARHDKGEELLRRAIELHVQVGDRKGAARATGALGWAMRYGHSQAALELLQGAAAQYADLWPDTVMVELKIRLARVYTVAEEHRRSVELADEALDVAEHADLLPLLAQALIIKGKALGALGHLREAIALVGGGEALSRANDLTEPLLEALAAAGFLLLEVDGVASLQKYREGLALARRTGNRNEMLHSLSNVGYIAFLTGDWDESLAVLDEGLAEDPEPGWRAWLLSNAVIVRAGRGEPVAGGLAELEQLTSLSGDPNQVLPTFDAKASAALADGRLGDAREFWRRYGELSASQAPAGLYQAARGAIWSGRTEQVRSDLEALDATGFHGRVVEVRRLTLRAALAAMEGRTTEALGLYRDALTCWHGLGMAWDEALTGIDMVSVLDPSNPEVRAVAQSTREILVRLRAQPFIERLDSALARASSASTAAREAAALAVTAGSS